MSWLKKIWNDSVWSQVIATLLAPYVLAALAAITGFFTDKGYKQQLLDILNIGIPLWVLPLVVIVTVVVMILYRRHKEKKNVEKSVIRHRGPYITFKGKPQDQCFCAVCWDNNHRKVQLPHLYPNTFKCPVCNNEGGYEAEQKESSYPYIMRY